MASLGLPVSPKPLCGRQDLFLVDAIHIYVYHLRVKKKELEKRLRDLGWVFLRAGGNHDVWTNGEDQEYVPRHAEIGEGLARRILKRVREKPGR